MKKRFDAIRFARWAEKNYFELFNSIDISPNGNSSDLSDKIRGQRSGVFRLGILTGYSPSATPILSIVDRLKKKKKKKKFEEWLLR